jgi:hypothetical protein
MMFFIQTAHLFPTSSSPKSLNEVVRFNCKFLTSRTIKSLGVLSVLQSSSPSYTNVSESWNLTHMWKTLAWAHDSLKRRGLKPMEMAFNTATFYWSFCTKPKHSCVWQFGMGVSLHFISTIFQLDVGTLRMVWYIFVFHRCCVFSWW